MTEPSPERPRRRRRPPSPPRAPRPSEDFAPPPRVRSKARGWIVIALPVIAVGLLYAWKAKVAGDETEARLMATPVTSLDCAAWAHHAGEVFANAASDKDAGTEQLVGFLAGDTERMTMMSCNAKLAEHRIPADLYTCLSNEMDYGQLLLCEDEAEKAAR